MANIFDIIKSLGTVNPNKDYDFSLKEKESEENTPKPEEPPAPKDKPEEQNSPVFVPKEDYDKVLAEIENLKQTNYALLNNMAVKKENNLSVEDMLYNVCVGHRIGGNRNGNKTD